MYRLLRCCMVLALALLTFACDNPTLEPLPADGVILAFGDSLTAGVGASKSQSYPAVLERLSGLTVVNAGVSGEVTAAGQARLAQEIDRHAPDLLLLLEGGNDILRNHDLTRTKANLAAMIEQAQSRGIEVVLIGVPAKNLFSDVAPFYEDLAQEYAVVFIPDLVSDLLRNPEYKSDRIHLNPAGYRTMAEEIHAVLRKHGAL